MAFDPCREWLGIDAVDLADPVRVLGLGPDARDSDAIGRAAEARLEALRLVAPGPFAKAHAALLAKVEEARDTLLAQAFLQVPATCPPAPVPPVVQGPPLPFDSPHPLEPQPPRDEPGPVTALETAVVDFAPAIRPSTRRRRASAPEAGGLLLASFALLAGAVMVLLALMLRPELFGRPAVGRPRSVASQQAPRPPSEPQPAPARTTANGPRVPPDHGSTPAENPAGSAPVSRPRKQAPEQEARRPPVDDQAASAAKLAGQEAAGRAAEDVRRQQERETAEAERERARTQEWLDASLRDAYAALRRGEFDTADRLLAAAGKQVGDDVDAATRLERWQLLATYARGFVGYRDQAFAAANAGREFTLDGKPFAVVEITPEQVVYKLAGRMERVSRERLDPRIELAIVAGWFAADGRSANHLFLGARWLCLDPPNVARARAEWRIASNGGEQAGPLLALLDDPVLRRAIRGAGP